MNLKKSDNKNLCIICETSGYEPSLFKIVIADEDNNIVYSGFQRTRKAFYYNIKKEGKYQISVKALNCFNPQKAYRWTCINFNNMTTQYFVFNKISESPMYRRITFTLSDAKFKNMPIQKGEIILWQKTSF
jgi:hypothetical protein